MLLIILVLSISGYGQKPADQEAGKGLPDRIFKLVLNQVVKTGSEATKNARTWVSYTWMCPTNGGKFSHPKYVRKELRSHVKYFRKPSGFIHLCVI